SLVFLDVDAPPAPKAKPGARPGLPVRPIPPPVREPEPVAEPDPSLQIESTSLVEGLEPTNVPLEGFETTSADFGAMRLEANEVESLREEVTAEDVRPRADLEPTVPDEAETATESEIDLEPLLDIEIESPPPEPEPDCDPEAPTASSGRRSGAIDLSLDDQAGDAAERSSLVFAGMDATSAQPTIEDLEARVADDPDDPEAHQALGEALIEEGERERGIEELNLATTGFENLGNLPQARDLV